jgi:hypothetical protein
MSWLNDPWPDILDVYLRAWEYRPVRAEPLYAIARRYRNDQRYQLGYLFAERAARIPLPTNDYLFVNAEVYLWRALDEQAVCASWIGKQEESFELCRRLLARDDIADDERMRIAGNRDISAPPLLEAASAYPGDVVDSLNAGLPDSDVTVTIIAGPDRAVTERALNSFLNCCTDVSRVGRFVIIDTGLSAIDRAALLDRYRFLEFHRTAPETELTQLLGEIPGRFLLHLGQGWRFFGSDNFIERLIAVLEAEPAVAQVGINFGDAAKLTGACAPRDAVRRTASAGGYVLTDGMANGPAMFDVTRLRQSDPTLLRTASLDEVLCIAEV